MSDLCKVCEEGDLIEGVEANLIACGGVCVFVDSYYSTCNKCGAIQVSAEQSRINKQIAADFKRSVDGRA